MVGDIHIYRRVSIRWKENSNGSVSSRPVQVVEYYKCKHHHPRPSEIAQIYQELAEGYTKTSIARKHQLGNTTHRLARLLRKWEIEFPHLSRTVTEKRFTNGDLACLLRLFDG